MASRHDPTTMALHWLTAILVVLLWLSAQFIDYFPKGPARWNMVGTHMAMGVTLALLTGWRVGWRLSRRSTHMPVERSTEKLARLVHVTLYVLLIASLALGLWNAWVRGEHVFNLFQIPAFEEGNKALRKWAGAQHKLFVYLLLALVGLHALAGLAHHYIRRDAVLQRMLPRRFSTSPKAQHP